MRLLQGALAGHDVDIAASVQGDLVAGTDVGALDPDIAGARDQLAVLAHLAGLQQHVLAADLRADRGDGVGDRLRGAGLLAQEATGLFVLGLKLVALGVLVQHIDVVARNQGHIAEGDHGGTLEVDVACTCLSTAGIRAFATAVLDGLGVLNRQGFDDARDRDRARDPISRLHQHEYQGLQDKKGDGSKGEWSHGFF